ncbi:MAG TPA: hypothetical protein VGG07_12865 [Solirubrobacteraceae bacterium]|jgi:hypothetical protein
MTKFTDHLWRDLVQEHGPTLAQADRPAAGRGRLRRPRVLAGSTLGLAGVGAALVLALGGTAATTPAFAVTTSNDGSVLVNLNYHANQNLPQVNHKLIAMGTNEQITIYMSTGAATTQGPVTCAPGSGVRGPAVRVLVGKDGTEVIAPGESGDNTAEGTFHLDHCTTSNPGSGNAGNTGTAG